MYFENLEGNLALDKCFTYCEEIISPYLKLVFEMSGKELNNIVRNSKVSLYVWIQ